MKKEIYMAAARGNTDVLNEAQTKDVEAGMAIYSDDDLLGLTSHGNNIIHVAVKHEQLEFIKKALETIGVSFASQLISGKNNDGDTPLHLAAKHHTSTIADYLIANLCKNSEWKIRNNEGNTPLHVALLSGGKSIQVASYLLEVGPEVASYVNHRNETPLHLAVDCNNEGAKISITKMFNTLNGLGASLDYKKCLFEEDSLSLTNSLLQKNATVCCLQDVDGMTPLLRATLNSYYSAVEAMISYCPESVEICGPKGKTLLHHIKFPSFLQARNFLSIPEMSTLMDCQDEDGNTPLHVAIINNDFDMVKALIECNANFAIKNKEGTSTATLIHSSSSTLLDKMKDYMRRSSNKDEVMMSKELFEAVHKEDWQYLLQRLNEASSDDDVKHFLSRLPNNGSNILHVAVQRSSSLYEVQDKFIAETSKRFPILMCQTDLSGRTPLHYHRRIATFRNMLDALKQIKDQRAEYPLPPWEVKDLNGDTPLHIAISWHQYEMAKSLLRDVSLVP